MALGRTLAAVNLGDPDRPIGSELHDSHAFVKNAELSNDA